MKLQPNPIFAHRNFVLSSDNLSNCILNSGAIHEANSQAIIGWANVPPFFFFFFTMPIDFVWSILYFGVNVNEAFFFLFDSSAYPFSL